MSASDAPKSGDARPCRACGMPIEFRVGPNGRTIPLQRVRKVYVLGDALHGGKVEDRSENVLLEGEGIFVSHWETCPNAGAFNKPKG